MKVLCVGRQGQIARALAETEDLFSGLELVALGRPQLDLLNASSVQRAVEAHAPDLIINTAAFTAVDAAESDVASARAINTDAAQMLAELASNAGIRLIHYSTDYVFDGATDIPYKETDPVNPLGMYGETKLAGESAVLATDTRHLVLRTSWIFSAFGQNFVKTMLRLARDSAEVSVVNDQVGSPTNAMDVAHATLSICEKLHTQHVSPNGGIYHLASQGFVSWADFARAIYAASATLGGPTATVVPIASAEFPTAAERPKSSRLDTTKLSSVFGIRLPKWQSSLGDTVNRILLKEAGAQ